MINILDGRILKKVLSKSYSKLKDKYNINDVEIRILLALDENKDVDLAKDLEDILLVTKGAISVAIQDLEEKKLLKRIQDNNNKKIFHLKLIDKSLIIINEAKEIKKKMLNDIYEGITDKQKQVVEDVYNIMSNNIKLKYLE